MFQKACLWTFGYMAVTLWIFLPILFRLNKKKTFAKLTVRKFYHLLAFGLFAPPLFFFDQSKALARMMIFAFNCVTVLLILLEVFRHKCSNITEGKKNG